jgi:hypothetical protein
VESIGNDPDEGKKLLLRANDLDQRRAKMAKSNLQEQEGNTAMDSDSAILTVNASGVPIENGRVIAANMAAGQLFNQPSDFLVNKSIGTILLEPFAQGFDDIVHRSNIHPLFLGRN